MIRWFGNVAIAVISITAVLSFMIGGYMLFRDITYKYQFDKEMFLVVFGSIMLGYLLLSILSFIGEFIRETLIERGR